MAENNVNYNQLKRQLEANKKVKELPITDTFALKFDSDFESGNLDLAARTFLDRNDEYDLLLRLDSNSKTHQQWFYFSCETRGNYKNHRVRFNLLNFTKPHSLYQRGMLPVVWSERLYKATGTGWHRAGTEVRYDRS